MQEKKRSKRIWIPILIVLLVVFLLAYVIDLNDLIDAFRRVNPELLVLGILFMVLGLLLIPIRWRYLLDNRIGFLTAFQTDAIIYMIRMFTPILVPILRVTITPMATYLTVSQATSGMMAERLMEVVLRLVALIVAIFLISTSNVAPGWVILWIVLLAGVFIGLVWFSNHAEEYLPRFSTWLARLPRLDQERLEGPITGLGEGLATVGTTRRLVTSLLLSVLMWSAFLISQAFLLAAVDINLSVEGSLAVSAAVLVVLPPSTPAMIGVYQGLLVALLVPFRIADAPELLAYSIVLFCVMMVFWLITGLWSLKRTHLDVRELVKLPGSEKSEPRPE